MQMLCGFDLLFNTKCKTPGLKPKDINVNLTLIPSKCSAASLLTFPMEYVNCSSSLRNS